MRSTIPTEPHRLTGNLYDWFDNLCFQGKLNNSASELATILEHETMEFSTSLSVDHADDQLDSVDAPLPDKEEPSHPGSLEDVGQSSSSSDSLAENLHALPL